MLTREQQRELILELRSRMPGLMYKYRSASAQDLNSLSRKKIYVPTLYELDDIQESIFDFILDEALRADNHYFPTVLSDGNGDPVWIPLSLSRTIPPEEADSHRARIIKEVEAFCKKIFSKGVYCLVTTPLSNSMWGLYGNSHNGYCIEYRLPEANEFLENISLMPMGVDYSDEPPSIDWAYAGLYDTLLYNMIGVKPKEWERQQEFRIVYPIGGVEYGFPLEISSIIFGARAGEILIADIRAIFGNSITYKRASTTPHSYNMKLVDL